MKIKQFDIREKLLDQGVNLMMENGYHGTGLKDILQSVNVPKGSFYHYFSSKEEFASNLISHYIQPFIERLDRNLAIPGVSAANALLNYFDELIKELERANFKGGCLLGNLLGEIGDTSDLCRNALKLALLDYRDKIKAAISRGQLEGDFRNDRNAEELADLLVNLWQGALLRMKVEQSSTPLEQCRQMLQGELFRCAPSVCEKV